MEQHQNGFSINPDKEPSGICALRTSQGTNNDGTDINVTTKFPHIVDIKKALPKHCFEPNIFASLYFVVKDFVIIFSLYSGMLTAEYFCDNEGPLRYLLIVVYPVYWFAQGTMFWALFVLGHDCGHGSFSTYDILNDVIGNFLHGFILVPYYPWKLSHKHHHKNTGNIDCDEIFYPIRQRDWDRDIKVFPGFALGCSWFLYLFYGYPPRSMCHFNPFDNMLKTRYAWCALSVLTVMAMVCCAIFYYTHFGFRALLCHYLLAVFVFASWLVVVTFLHHNDEHVPWYSDKIWTNVGGQLSSVDRDYGLLHGITHNIGTHQIHHLFIKIPHYYLEDAASSFRKTFPHLARVSKKPIIIAFVDAFKLFRDQRHIGNDVDIHQYISKQH